MDFFISNAWAEGGAGVGAVGEGLAGMVPLILIFVIFYFLILRPQIKRAKEHKQMVTALAKGDEIVTNGGLMAKVTGVAEEVITVELSQGVQVKMQKAAVASLLPKGTLKEK